MAPLPAAANPADDLRRVVQQREPSSEASLKDWKELIDNGGVGGGNNRSPAAVDPTTRQNLTAVMDGPTPSRAPSSGSDLIPLYCGLLGALICGLVLWIVLKQARRRARDSKLQPPACETGATDGADSDCRQPGRLSDLSESRMRRLEQILDDGSRWKALATELGYSEDAVAQLEARARLESASAAGLLLRSWAATTSSSTEPAADPEAKDAEAGDHGDDLRRRLLSAGLPDAAAACQRDPAERRRHHHHHHHHHRPQVATSGDPAAVQLTAV